MDALTFDDFDAFAASVEDADLEIMIRNPGRRRWSLRHLQAAGIHLQQGDEGSGGIAQGQSRADGYLLFFPLTMPEAQHANGHSLQSNTITVLEPGCEFCITAEADHRWCTVFVPTESLRGSTPQGSGRPRVRRVTHPAAGAYLQMVERLFRAAEVVPKIETTGVLDDALHDVCSVSSQLVRAASPPAPRRQGGRPLIPRDEAIKRAKRLIESREGETISLRDLVAACGVSERTTRSLFGEYFGASPQQFLHLRQLHQVRRALISSDPAEVAVSQVMSRYGVWEFGRFAGRYHKIFGELPSETLARAARS